MAVSRFGDANPLYGMQGTTYFQEATSRRLSDEVTCENKEGECITVAYINKRVEGTVTTVGQMSDLGSFLGALSATSDIIATTGTARITEIERRSENKGFTRFTATFKAYDLITN